MLDYHLHLWPHTDRDAPLRLDQIAAYCERAAAAGVVEIALTEHLFRFVESRPLVDGLFDATEPSAALRRSMADYWDFHARTDLDRYVGLAMEAKEAGLPVLIGLEVDHYRGRMDRVADLLAGYPFDVLLGSVHWLGGWRFDDVPDPLHMAEWSTRAVDAAWDQYCEAMEELAASGAVDVLAHPDLVKCAGHRPAHPAEWWERIAEAAAAGGLAAELSSAGWRKPAGEQYPAEGLLARLCAKGVPLTTASDAHQLEQVADRADDLRALLATTGVTHLRGFRRRQPHTVPLAPTAPGGD